MLVGDVGKYIAFVHFGDKSIKANSLIDAVKICLDYYLGINIAYQEHCLQVWFFIQTLCGVFIPHDLKYPSVVTLLNDLKKI